MHIVPNFWATLVAAACYFVIGGLWYAAIFSKAWQAAIKLSAEELEKAKKAFPMALATHLVSGIITAYVIGRIVEAVNASGFVAGIAIGLWCWVGFAFTLLINALMFERRPRSVFWINFGFYLIAFVVVGGIMASWRAV